MRSFIKYAILAALTAPFSVYAGSQEIIRTAAEGEYREDATVKACSPTLIAETLSKSYALVGSKETSWRLVKEGTDGNISNRSLETSTVSIGPFIQPGVDYRLISCRTIQTTQKLSGYFFVEAEARIAYTASFKRKTEKLGQVYASCLKADEPNLDCVSSFGGNIPEGIKNAWMELWKNGSAEGWSCFEKPCDQMIPGRVYVHKDLLTIGGDEIASIVEASAMEYLDNPETPMKLTVVPWSQSLLPGEFRVVPPVEMYSKIEGLPENVSLASGRCIPSSNLYMSKKVKASNPCLNETRFLDAWELNDNVLIKVKLDLAATFNLERVFLMPMTPLYQNGEKVGEYQLGGMDLFRCPDGKKYLSSKYGIVRTEKW